MGGKDETVKLNATTESGDLIVIETVETVSTQLLVIGSLASVSSAKLGTF